ncbi:hypothetical protein MMC17_010119 [Xylographa soralifera]|nr:hypothetical protein [Xylographa soralifera]
MISAIHFVQYAAIFLSQAKLSASYIKFMNATTKTSAPLASLTSCSPGCNGTAEVTGFYWYSSIVTNVVATLMVTISAFEGVNFTSSSLIRNITPFTLPPDAQMYLSAIGTGITVDGTTLSVGPGQTATWPETYVFVENAITFSGECGVIPSIVTIPLPTGQTEFFIPAPLNGSDFSDDALDIYLPSEYLELAGLAANCIVVGDGIPAANIPVTTLTSTLPPILIGNFGSASTQSSLTSMFSSQATPGALLSITAPPTKSSQSSTYMEHTSAAQTEWSSELPTASSSPLDSVQTSTQVSTKDSVMSNLSSEQSQTSAQAQSLVSSHELPSLTIGDSIVTAIGSKYIFASQTIVAGGTAIMISGTTISLAQSAGALIIGSVTETIPQSTGHASVVTIDGFAFTPSGSGLVAGSQTLLPGSVITVSETHISLAPSAIAVVIGSSTIPLEPLAGITSHPLGLPVFTFDGSILTANSQSDFVVGSQTLLPMGPTIIVSGIPISLVPGGTEVVIGTVTETISVASSQGLAGLIISGLGGGAASPTSMSTDSLGKPFTGDGVALRCPWWYIIATVSATWALI